MSSDFGGLGKQLLSEGNEGSPAHHESTAKQNATDSQGAQTLHLSVPGGEAFRGGLERPRDGGQGHDIANKVGETMDGIGNEGLNEAVSGPWRGA